MGKPDAPTSLRFLVMGAGAMGSAVGGLLAHAGHKVTLIGRRPHMEAIRSRGLHITGIWGDYHIVNLSACTSVREVPPQQLDCILITVKSYDTEEAARAIVPLVSKETLVCSYQNGLGNVETIAHQVGWERTIGARVIFGVRLVESGTVHITVIAEPTALGVFSPAAPAQRVKKLAQIMSEAGVPTRYSEEIESLLWAKVAYNASLNCLSALLDVPYGTLAEVRETRAVIEQVVCELYSVGEACGVRLRPPSASAYLEYLFGRLIPPTASHYASMREDFLMKRRTEIDALNGAVVRLGKAHGIQCPTNELLTQLIKAAERLYLDRTPQKE